MVRHLTALVVTLALTHPTLAAVRGDQAAYLGGTARIPEKARGTFDFTDNTVFGYVYDGGKFELPYRRITSIEYGDKVGHRVGAAVALGVTLIGLLAIPVAFAKKAKHYLTIGYTQDDGKPGALVWELPKSNYWITIQHFSNRTGLRPEEVKHEKALAAQEAPPMPGVRVYKSELPRVTVESEPPGATILVEGYAAGTTPAQFPLQVGSYRVALRKAGFHEWSGTLEVQAGKPATLKAMLAATN